MCVIWLLIAEQRDDERFVNTSSKLIDSLCAAQTKTTFINLKGGLAGSKPFFGRYIAFRQPNWASKYFMDALLSEDQAYTRLKANTKIKPALQ